MRPLLLLALLLIAAPAWAQKVLPEARLAATRSADPNACTLGNARSELNANDVRAALYNNGGLFWKGAGNVYNVPVSQTGTPNAIFAAGIWMGGKVNGKIHMVAADYAGWELWPGPLDASGNPPTDCAPYDRIFAISKADLADYERDGSMTDDLRDWPYQWGAPVVDGDGNPDNYDLAAGDRPEVLGHETHWWVMNDAAGPHGTTGTDPINMEVRVSAYAADSDDDAIAQTTLYRYRLTYRGTAPFTDAWFGLFVDPDLGNATDDYIGSDTTLDMGFVYNGDDFDEGSDGYGQAPPALGTVFLKGLDEAHPDREMSVFLMECGTTSPCGNPRSNTTDWYNYLRGIWQDGKPMLDCGYGYDPSGLACAATADSTTFLWPGDPVTGAFWSERNYDGAGNSNYPNDRTYLMSTGPFTMQPGETKDVVLAIVYARGADHLDSVTELRKAVVTVREAWADGFDDLPALTAPSAPVQLASPADGAADQPARMSFVWEPVEHARTYDLDLHLADGETVRDTVLSIIGETDLTLVLDSLATIEPGMVVTWRVRGRNGSGAAPWSEARTFTLSGERLVGQKAAFADFLTVANAAGPLDPFEYGALDPNHRGFPRSATLPLEDATDAQQVGPDIWGIHTAGNFNDFAGFVSRTTRDGGTFATIGRHDYEWRFTGTSVAWNAFQDDAVYDVPFELWDIGLTPDDPSDDVRLIPLVLENAPPDSVPNHVFDIGPDHPTSGGTNDPHSDWVYWYQPADMSPGETGYNAYVADIMLEEPTFAPIGKEVFARMVVVNFNGCEEWSGTCDMPLPEQGTIFRIVTSKIVPTPPVVSAPAEGAVLEKTATWLYWQEPPETPAQRTVQLARDIAFTDIVRSDTVTTAGVHAVSALVPGQKYHWRVQFGYAGGALSPWSVSSSFTVSPTATGAAANGEMPAVLTLDRLWPNPAQARATVRFGLPAAGPVRIAVYDVLGREVLRVRDVEEAAGWHEATFDTSPLASGVYLVRLEAGGRSRIRSLVVVR